MPQKAWEELKSMKLGSQVLVDLSHLRNTKEVAEMPLGRLSLALEDQVSPTVPYTLAICMGPIWGQIDTVKWVEYIEYHRRAVRVDHFFVYCHSGTGANSPLFAHYSKIGLLTRIEWTSSARGDNLEKSSYYYDQGQMYNDCLMRNKFQSKWLAMIDIDEYLLVPPLPGVLDEDSLQSLLTERFSQAAALRLLRVGFGIGEANSSKMMIERRQERTPVADHWGRKGLVNPFRTRGVWIHWASEYEVPPPGAGPYEDECYVPMDLIMVGHYRHQKGSVEVATGPFVIDEPKSNAARWASSLERHVLSTLKAVT